MNVAEGVDVSVIVPWLGHQRTQPTDAYLLADLTINPITTAFQTRHGLANPVVVPDAGMLSATT